MNKNASFADKVEHYPAPGMRQAALLAAAGVLCILLSACRPSAAATPTAEQADSIVISTFTASPTEGPAAPEPSTPASTASPELAGRIPGLSPRNVTVGLEDLKFTCTQVRKAANYQRTCTRGVPNVQVYQVVISGREPFLVDLIEATLWQYENPDPEAARQILGFLASLSYDGAAPDEAQAWVEGSLPGLTETQEAVFGGVRFVLSGTPREVKLKMGE